MLRRNAANSPSLHWSKDFVEHLRTIHFLLLAVSVGLILIVSRPNSPALLQIRQILALKKSWPPNWIFYDRLDTQDKSGQENKEAYRLVWGKTNSIYAVALWNKRPTTFTIMRVALPEVNWHEQDSIVSLAEFPTTLADFRDWWGHLRNDNVIFVPYKVYEGDVWYAEKSIFDQPSPVAKALLVDKESVDFLEKTKTKLVTKQSSVLNLSLEGDSYQGTLGSYFYELPVATAKVIVDQDLICTGLARHTSGFRWKPGAFEQSFAQLAQEASGLEAEDLDQVERIIAERLANRSEEFDAFGMKFPIDQVTGWGTLIILSVQLYFLLYLRQLYGRLRPDDPGWDTPWICLNQSRLAQLTSFVTIVLLPCIAVFLLSGRGSLRLTSGY